MMSDADLRREVENELSWNSAIQSREVGVTAHEGIVTLTGYVRTFGEKLEAEKAAKRLQGVKGIANDIEVKLDGSMHRTDPEIAQVALNSLKWNSAVPDDKVKVIVRDGRVMLEGEVDSYYQRASAEASVRSISGVRGVSNNITIKPSASPPVDSLMLKSKIEEAFRRSALIDARRIQVTTTGHDVSLRGKVRSFAEFEEASAAAWATPGVMHVSNQLTIGN